MDIPGGGWVIHNRHRRDGYARLYAALGAVVAVIDHRLCPRVLFPEDLKDCIDAYNFLADNAERFGIACPILCDPILVQFFGTAAHPASLSIINSQSLLKLMSIESVMPSNYLIFCHPLLLLPSIFSSIRVFSNESVLHIRWPKY